ncbi:MAG: hypothetical protein A2821_02490 [Candidatus Magasanikbacteria bacterium RIFCSPHIGHO2_01_FULL_41_23]|uniref:Short-chain dehydrogenase n=1 Tax=Candidatus Magasanikbacteria bacterium RIFCSPLOWO2_01_FULL_40_15 TaxID=1798686 RepID=A0A1F6N2C3_9BACT|nr:MAG: hypothetical protein A2821_02490 [Candidatus Magasanikbacteria bacterium RIFCSPHIGHO2_01_FULL_41_23]OGH66877.1 MAG: hypothetical protein A3C66_02270 [Candidatus Magasanikbacteria bacterium RIFCSPHIGHO2_02_FULL_41_35]OGH74861.1 MAG: hypothetical protein A3F22_04200 [Candidatus Magasanikbacteria bacterium RIFCSPHIGHO2_12_FULL_41_16]OGH78135.1 MAG: hypothetical protein A2983_03620 [Candidatus Magasanikbacteria bacterium RIFCSPLOWO2_01_FULL_40_15]
MIQLNITALTSLCRLFLPEMMARKSGKILNVASTAAFQPGPFMAVYFATKAYVLSLSEALSEETRHTGVTVSALCPGPTKTSFQNRAGADKTEIFKNNGVMNARSVAEIAYAGLMKNKRIIIPSWRHKIIIQLLRVCPRALTTKIMRNILL